MHESAACQSRQAANSDAHMPIAVRANTGGASTVPKNRKAPNVSQSVRATASSTAVMVPRIGLDAYPEPAARDLRRPPRRETRVEGSMSRTKLAAGAAVLAVGRGGVAAAAVAAAPNATYKLSAEKS